MLTKSDLLKLGRLIDQKLDAKLESKLNDKLQPIKKSLKRIEKDLTTSIKLSEKQLNYHHRRLVQLEEKAGVKPPSFLPASN